LYFDKEHDKRRKTKNDHYKWDIPVGLQYPPCPQIKSYRFDVRGIYPLFATEDIRGIWISAFNKNTVQNKGNGEDEIRQQNIFYFCCHKFFVVESGIINMVEQKSGDEDKKSCPSESQIGNPFLEHSINCPP
jgi:hypothetical protein